MILSVDGLGGSGAEQDAGIDAPVDGAHDDTSRADGDPTLDTAEDDAPGDTAPLDALVDTIDAGGDAVDDAPDGLEAAADAPVVACATCALTALYRTSTTASPTAQILPFVEISNAGASDQPLVDVTVNRVARSFVERRRRRRLSGDDRPARHGQ